MAKKTRQIAQVRQDARQGKVVAHAHTNTNTILGPKPKMYRFSL